MAQAILSKNVQQQLRDLGRNDTIYDNHKYMYEYAKFLADNLPPKITGKEFNVIAKHTLAELVCAHNRIILFKSGVTMSTTIPIEYSRLTKLSKEDYAFMYDKIKELAILSLPEYASNDAQFCWNKD